jgi:hypothetical protein
VVGRRDRGGMRSDGATALTLADLKVSKDQSSRWQRLADVPGGAPSAQVYDRGVMSATDTIDPRDRLAAERERNRKASEPPRRAQAGETWRPSPTQGEANLTARSNGYPVLKCYDLSPIDAWAFDPTEPPALPAPPSNTSPPTVTPLTDLATGSQLVISGGTWTPAGLVFARQWLRNGASIWGATAVVYVPDYRDVGAMIGCRVTATNAGGSVSADAAPVGPIVEP